MSRLSSMSAAAIKAIFSQDSDSDILVLLTIYDPEDPDTVVMRLCDGYTQRIASLTENPDELVYGTVSRGNDFVFVPMEISLPSEQEAEAPRSSIVLRDVTQYAIPLIRTINGPPKILMELVLSKTPDVPEATFSGFFISSFNYSADSISMELSMTNYNREPFPQHSFSPVYFPGLF